MRTRFETAPLRRHIDKTTNGSTATQIEADEATHRVTRIETISAGTINLEKTGYVSGSESLQQFALENGDILFSHINSMSVIGNSALVTSEVLPLYVGMNLLRIRPSSAVKSEFLSWCLKSDFIRHQVRQFAKPAINQASISTTNLKRVMAPLPDLSTQREIADFLDRETARIDLLIEKKQKLVVLLGEKGAAYVEEIVTNGFTFQPSRNQRIRDDGWKLAKLKNLSSRLKVGVVVNPSDYIDDDGEIPFIYGGNIREYTIDFSKCRRMSAESSRKLMASRLRPGDVVVVRVGAPGVAAVVPEGVTEANCASIMCITSKACSGEWLAYAFNTRFVRHQVEVVQYGAAQKQFNLEHAREFTIPIPPRTQEANLIRRLNAYRDRNLKVKTTTIESIDRLKEYRSALITAAVTGQIDVTTYAKSGTTDRRLDAIQEEMGA